MGKAGIERETTAEGDLILHLRGRLDRERVADYWDATKEAVQSVKPPHLVLNFEKVSKIDSAGVALLRTIESYCRSRGIILSRQKLSDAAGDFLRYAEAHSSGEGAPPESAPGAFSRLGLRVMAKGREAADFIRLVGEFTFSGTASLLHPGRIRFRETFYQLQRAGYEAMPLVMGLSFLMGIIMSFDSAKSLQSLGAPIYIADLVTLSTTREMAPLLTAIIIAGRSGAAFAAEIGSMKINEEIDALKTMGFDIIHFLVFPRVLALTLAGPLLTMLADAAGILGGGCIGFLLFDVSFENFLAEVRNILSSTDIFTGLMKGTVFAALVGFVGCFQGLRAGIAPESVGKQTTSAVVSGILLIIAANAVLAAIFQIYGW